MTAFWQNHQGMRTSFLLALILLPMLAAQWPSHLLTGHPNAATMTDGAVVDVQAKPSGTFKFMASNGLERTVERMRYVGTNPPARRAFELQNTTPTQNHENPNSVRRARGATHPWC